MNPTRLKRVIDSYLDAHVDAMLATYDIGSVVNGCNCPLGYALEIWYPDNSDGGRLGIDRNQAAAFIVGFECGASDTAMGKLGASYRGHPRFIG